MRYLPREGAFVHSLDREGAEWGLTQELLAGLIEVVDAGSWRAVSPYMKKNAKPKLLHVPRPHEESPRTERRQATPEDLVELLGPPGVM